MTIALARPDEVPFFQSRGYFAEGRSASYPGFIFMTKTGEDQPPAPDRESDAIACAVAAFEGV